MLISLMPGPFFEGEERNKGLSIYEDRWVLTKLACVCVSVDDIDGNFPQTNYRVLKTTIMAVKMKQSIIISINFISVIENNNIIIL